MEPIEIDVVLQLPIPIAMRWPDQDIVGAAIGGGAETIILPQVDPMWVGMKIDVWVGGVEFRRKVTAVDPVNRVVTVNEPWSPVLKDGSRVMPTAGCPFRVEMAEIINLPRLGIDGLLPWLSEVTEERREAVRKGIKLAGITGRELAAAQASVEMNAPAVVTDLNIPVQTPAGIRRVLQLSLAKTTLAPERQAIVLEKIMAWGFDAANLAYRLSTLFYNYERRPAPEVDKLAEAAAAFPGIRQPKAKEADGPLAESPAEPVEVSA